MSKFHTLKVAKIQRETADCVSIVLDVPPALSSNFQYIQGQYITFKLTVKGQEIRRSYSVCSSPLADSELRVAVKKVKDGRGSVYLNEVLKEGDAVEVMEPMGNFYTPVNASHQKHYVLFAGGSGITPMLSIIKTVLHAEPQSRISLLYGNLDEASVIFYQQLKDLEQQSNGRFKNYFVLQQAPAGYDATLTGMLDKAKNLELLRANIPFSAQDEYFICGPTPMMKAVEEALGELKADAAKIHLEYFTAPAEEPTTGTEGKSYKNAKITIICDGEEVHTTLNDEENILEAALRMNLDAPYACQGGSCCTCRAKLVSGEVEMKVNYALLDSEVKEGFILTCQSFALSDEVVVDYDRGR
jgi:ring-1,2-phenylacetyl-CoA epoxidase subunit PaaE